MTYSQPEGFLALPPSGSGRGVLVLHAWWGLNDTIKSFCTHLADSGLIAYAPDLYHGQLATTIPEAEGLSSKLDADEARTDIAKAVNFLSQRAAPGGHDLAVVGFSLGAYFALELSNTDPDHIRSVVVFYGTGHEDYSASRAEYLGHFAEEDDFEPVANVNNLEQLLRTAGRPVTIHLYPGTGHWFFEPDRPQAFNQSAASLAWDRTLAFLRRSSA
ncbi:MAG: dienelactone hydrolase family protein [Chloroflexota bacterium]